MKEELNKVNIKTSIPEEKLKKLTLDTNFSFAT